MKHATHRRLARLTSLLLCLTLLCPLLSQSAEAAPVTRTLRLGQAQSMALKSSSDIKKQSNEILLKQMKYVEAVSGIKAKMKNLTSFRWTPLLSFKFPQKLDLTKDYELDIKPLVLQTEIDNMMHKLTDLRYEVTHTVNQQYFDAYLLQETAAFTQSRLDDAQIQLTRVKAQLTAGKATQTDVDRAQSAVDTLTKNLTNQLRDLEAAKTKLSETIGMNVSVGYKFSNGFKVAAIPREKLEELTQYTLDHDQIFYETKAAASTALLNLEAYEELMRGQYGSKMNPIQPFISMAKQGMEVDYAAFQIKYKEMLGKLDDPWAGKIRILFFTFTMEWFKGEISGTRYIEDEMYAVYTACMEYANAKKEQDTMERDMRAQVRDTYESVVTGWNTYQTLQKLAKDSRETLTRLLALNKLGKADFTEVADGQTAYQDAQQDAMDALGEYNGILSEFDRLTCGAVTKYLENTGMGLGTGEGGDAYAILDPINDPYYYIYTSVADLTFYVGISIPEGYEPAVDSFEIWYQGTRIGERTPVGEELRHLALDYADTGILLLRLYNGDEYVDECEIDAGVPRDKLNIQWEKPVTEVARVVGTYEIETTMQGTVSLSEITLRVDEAENAAGYTLTYGETTVYTTDIKPIEEPFSYLTILVESLDQVTAALYDAEGQTLETVHFNPETQELTVVTPSA